MPMHSNPSNRTNKRPADSPSSGASRRTQQMRSQESRRKLMEATIEVLLERGYAGLTTAQVDERAGVSSGARVHHYRSKLDLVVAAAEFIYERAAELGQHRAEAASRSAEPIRKFVDDCLTIYFDWPFKASVDLVLVARTDPEMMRRIHPVLDGFHRKMRQTWLDALIAAGYEKKQAETDLRLTLNLIRGMALNNIWESDACEYRKLLDEWCTRLAGRHMSKTGNPHKL